MNRVNCFRASKLAVHADCVWNALQGAILAWFMNTFFVAAATVPPWKPEP
jgi:hypothetical protein